MARREFLPSFSMTLAAMAATAAGCQRAAGGNEWLGVCVDTGWLGTQGVNAAQAIAALGPLVRHVHVKDVLGSGSHQTCRLGDGIVDIPAVLAALQAIGYKGSYSWE